MSLPAYLLALATSRRLPLNSHFILRNHSFSVFLAQCVGVEGEGVCVPKPIDGEEFWSTFGWVVGSLGALRPVSPLWLCVLWWYLYEKNTREYNNLH